MAPRARAAASSVDHNDSYPESSPDPLSASINESVLRRKSARLPRGPLSSSSPSKINRRGSYSEQAGLSPSKSMIMNTGRGGGASPWRIKVTVQAEPDSASDNENLDSPSVRRVTRTTTTTVPLKDDTASSPVKRRGRPRKSDTGAAAKPKRNGTPVRRRSPSKRRTSVAPSELSLADVSADAPPKRRRGRPRKSVQPTAEEEEALLVEQLADVDRASVIPTSISQEDTAAGVSVSDQSSQAAEPLHRATQSDPSMSGTIASEAPSSDVVSTPIFGITPFNESLNTQNMPVSTPQEHDLSKKLRNRKGTPHAKVVVALPESSDEDENELATPPETDEEVALKPEETIPKPATDGFLSNARSVVAMESDEEDEHHEVTTYAFDEGATRMPDDTTILESENFSMVSVDSLPSTGNLSSPLLDPSNENPRHGVLHATAAAPIPGAAAGGEENNFNVLLQTEMETANTSIGSTSLPQTVVSYQPRREITPLMESRSPSNPPAIIPAPYSPSQAETPKIGPVVKAGVALQGVLDPERLTPIDKVNRFSAQSQRDPLDDLFRGFSEGTRKQLQAGLRLGEQLAKEDDGVQHSSTTQSPSPATYKEDVFSEKQKQQQSRLLTPEDYEDYSLPAPPPAENNEIHYPSLPTENQFNHLISPSTSENEMSWRIDTPPVSMRSGNEAGQITAFNEHGEEIRGAEIFVVANDSQNKDHSDIWQEEASRAPAQPIETHTSSNIAQPSLHDLFPIDAQAKPARGKLPRTWRRRSSNDFNYSDELEEPAQGDASVAKVMSNEHDDTRRTTERSPLPSSKPNSPVPKPGQLEKRLLESPIPEEHDAEDEYEGSEVSDDTDTGMFFQSNLPSVFNKKRSVEMRRRKAEKLDLSLLLAEGESLASESSSANVASTSQEVNPPFLNEAPPRLPSYQRSPIKSSPLRHEIRASDSEHSFQYLNSGLESTLPQSSPFHTMVDESIISVASDARQLQAEMESARTDSSIRNVREEADAHAEAYESQYRTLEEIEEVTEPTRTKTSIEFPSSPPVAFEERSALRRTREYSPLFGETETRSDNRSTFEERSVRKTRQQPAISVTPPIEEERPSLPQNGGFFGLFSSLWGGRGAATAPVLHPVAMKFDALPNIEPWTKTHYKSLDALFQLHKKQPSLFDPSPPSVNAITNKALLDKFLADSKLPFVGARYSCWGYSVVMTEPLITLCAVYMQLLTLKDIAEYEKKYGKEIEMGECGPREAGLVIDEERVVIRLGSVVMGEDLRRDEKKGKEILREGGLQIDWPQ